MLSIPSQCTSQMLLKCEKREFFIVRAPPAVLVFPHRRKIYWEFHSISHHKLLSQFMKFLECVHVVGMDKVKQRQ